MAFDGEAATFAIVSVVDCVGGVATIATGREIGRGAGASHSNVVAEFLGREDGVIVNRWQCVEPGACVFASQCCSLEFVRKS